MTKPIAYLNGDFLPLAEARVSPLDRGFLFADGVYEVAPVYGRRLFCWSRHLRRLERSLRAVDLPFAVDDLTPIARELTARQGFADQSLYLQITRGAGATRAFAPPPDLSPTVFAFCAPFAPPVALAQKGIAATTIEDIRWRRADIKSVSLLGAVMAAAAAKERGAAEAILLRDGFLREGASSNVFVVCAGAGGGEIATPIADHSILAGITREIVIDSARRLGYAVRERAIAREELTAAAEMWICSSTREILPVVELDGNALGDGRPGAAFRAVYADFQARKESLCEN